jgi:hypothetical protein
MWRKSKDRQCNDQMKKQKKKQSSTKLYTENWRLNTNAQ